MCGKVAHAYHRTRNNNTHCADDAARLHTRGIFCVSSYKIMPVSIKSLRVTSSAGRSRHRATTPKQSQTDSSTAICSRPPRARDERRRFCVIIRHASSAVHPPHSAPLRRRRRRRRWLPNERTLLQKHTHTQRTCSEREHSPKSSNSSEMRTAHATYPATHIIAMRKMRTRHQSSHAFVRLSPVANAHACVSVCV